MIVVVLCCKNGGGPALTIYLLSDLPGVIDLLSGGPVVQRPLHTTTPSVASIVHPQGLTL